MTRVYHQYGNPYNVGICSVFQGNQETPSTRIVNLRLKAYPQFRFFKPYSWPYRTIVMFSTSGVLLWILKKPY